MSAEQKIARALDIAIAALTVATMGAPGCRIECLTCRTAAGSILTEARRLRSAARGEK